MTEPILTVNVDLDGVVYPWHEMMAVWVSELGGLNYEIMHSWDESEFTLPAPSRWDFAEEWGLTKGQLSAAFRLGIEKGIIWSKGRPLPDSVDSLWALDATGVYIRLVTTRLIHTNMHAKVQQATSAWLDEWNVPYHEIVYQGKYSPKGSFDADFAIDDKPENVFSMMENGISAYLLDRPWNRSHDLDVPRTEWQGFVQLVSDAREGVELLDEFQLEAWRKDQVTKVPAGSSTTQDEQ